LLISELKTEISLHLRDTGVIEVTTAQLLIFINSASRDAGDAGWFVPIAGAAITVAAGAVAVPAAFSHIEDIRNVATNARVERHYWKLEIVTATPSFVFEPSVRPTGASTVHGWRRPTIYTADPDTVDIGLESFLRDKACAHALTFMMAGLSELDRARMQLSEVKKRDAKDFLDHIPVQYQLSPLVRYVPGR